MKFAARIFAFFILLNLFLSPLYASNQQNINTGGSGIGDGDGHIMMTDDFVLTVTKMVSLDKINYVNASNELSPLSLPENELSIAYVKVSVTNLSDFTATDIYLDHAFYPGLSDLEFAGVRMISGDARFNEKQNRFIIDKLSVGRSASFEYSVALNGSGKSAESAIDSLLLANVESSLPIYHDGLNYVGIGQAFNTYLFAGSPFDLMGNGNGNSGEGDGAADGMGGGNDADGNGINGASADSGNGGANQPGNGSGIGATGLPFLTASGMGMNWVFYIALISLLAAGMLPGRKISH